MSIISDITVPARAPYSATLKAGQVMRIIDLESQQAVDALFYNPHELSRALFRAGHAGRAGRRRRCRSTWAPARCCSRTKLRPMVTIIADTCGFHDTSAGACSCESNTVRFGHETRFMHACRENFLTELGKYGMGKRDLVSNVNFFMNVPIRPNGELTVDDGVSEPGGYVDLRAEMDVLVLISNCPQVNNPCNGFNPTPIRIIISEG